MNMLQYCTAAPLASASPGKVLRAMEYGGVYVASAELENPGISYPKCSLFGCQSSARRMPEGSCELHCRPFVGFACGSSCNQGPSSVENSLFDPVFFSRETSAGLPSGGLANLSCKPLT